MELWSYYLSLRETPEFLGANLVNTNYSINWTFFIKLLSSLSGAVKKLLGNSAPSKSVPKGYERTVSMIEEYIEGLLWCLYMYTSGNCADYSFRYTPHIAPTAHQLFQYYLVNQSTEVLTKSSLRVATKSLPLPPVLFSLTVLPLSAKECLIPAIQNACTENSPIQKMLRSTKLEDMETVKELLAQMPSNLFTREQLSQTKQCEPSIILMRQRNHTLPKKKSFQLPVPKTPVARYHKLRAPSGVQALHFDLTKSKMVFQLQ